MSNGLGGEREISGGDQSQGLVEEMKLLDRISANAKLLVSPDGIDRSGCASFVETFKGEVLSSMAGTTDPLSKFRMLVPTRIRNNVAALLVDSSKAKVGRNNGIITQETKIKGLFLRSERGFFPNKRIYTIVGEDNLDKRTDISMTYSPPPSKISPN